MPFHARNHLVRFDWFLSKYGFDPRLLLFSKVSYMLYTRKSLRFGSNQTQLDSNPSWRWLTIVQTLCQIGTEAEECFLIFCV